MGAGKILSDGCRPLFRVGGGVRIFWEVVASWKIGWVVVCEIGWMKRCEPVIVVAAKLLLLRKNEGKSWLSFGPDGGTGKCCTERIGVQCSIVLRSGG